MDEFNNGENQNGGEVENKVNEEDVKVLQKEIPEKFPKYKNNNVIIGGAVVVSLIAGIGIGSATTGSKMNKEIVAFKQQVNEYKLDTKALNKQVGEKNAMISDLEKKVENAEPWFKMGEEEQRKIEEENARVEAARVAKEEEEKEAARVAEEKRLEEERIAKENAEKNKYETGITYNQLARTPDDYKGKKCKFKGKVIQTLESDGTVQIRIAVGGSYDNIILATYSSSLVSSRILEDDYITIYGTSLGVMTYESTMGKSITIPAMIVEKIDA